MPKASQLKRSGFVLPLLWLLLPPPALADKVKLEAARKVIVDHCIKCHGPDKQKGDLRLDTLSIDLANNPRAAETWHDALDQVSLGEMPPEDEPGLSSAERESITTWIRGNLSKASDKTSPPTVLRRLNKAEYRYTMTDLLGVEDDYGSDLPEDPVSPDGFTNNGSNLQMSGLQLEIYLQAARQALSRIIVQGPRPARVKIFDTKSVPPKELGKRKAPTSGPLTKAGIFGLAIKDPPRDHTFTIRVKAKALAIKGVPKPILRVNYGHKVPGAIPFKQTVGEIVFSGTDTQTFEFQGHARDFPYAPDSGSKHQQYVFVENVTVGKNGQKSAAEIESIEFIGNDFEQWPPAAHRNIFISKNPRQILRRFLSRAWRRPIAKPELDRWVSHFEFVHKQSESFEEAVQETLAVALTSPNFLYLIEPSTDGKPRRLDDYELAARISCFLWCSSPDDALLKAATSKDFRDPATLHLIVQRMLKHPKSERFIEQFTTQWLDLDGLDRVAINPQYFPKFDNTLKADMAGESRAYFAEILRSNTSALQLLKSDWTMLNAKLANHYKILGPKSSSFERVDLSKSKRPGGLLAHASILLANSSGEHSHPINRAVWIRKALLNDPPNPPPPDVPELETGNPEFANLSIREQLAHHRQKAACNDCHQSIDPWGIALEDYDAIGLFRTKVHQPKEKKKKPVDASTVLPGGHSVTGLAGLQYVLLTERKNQFARALTAKLLTYALGRSLHFSDQSTVDSLARNFAKNGYQLAPLIQEIVSSKPFLHR